MSKSYHLQMNEDYFNSLHIDQQGFLFYLGMEVRQNPTDDDNNDIVVKGLKKEIAKNYEKINKYLYDKRNK